VARHRHNLAPRETDFNVAARIQRARVPCRLSSQGFGGGGHENTAACTLRASLETATATLVAAVSEALDGRGA
jgi:nanoRNase/pAp phosphatase (c-di-AMP/oligoRNAs hydrolase)